jgi:hypothetical protein
LKPTFQAAFFFYDKRITMSEGGQRVMFDFDLAEMYQVETRVLNQALAELQQDSRQQKERLPIVYTAPQYR